MITVTAAGVLATILPIGLLIIGFEIRHVPPVVATGRSGTVLLWVMGGIFCLGLTLGFWAEYRLVRAVVENVDVGPIGTWLVMVGLLCVGWSSFLLLGASLGVALGLTERIGRGARAKVEASPRRLARQIDYVEKHHPSVRSGSPE